MVGVRTLPTSSYRREAVEVAVILIISENISY